MAIEFRMPALSPTMEKGTIAKWLVKDGDRISPGDLIAEIETDKATMEIEAVDEGVVASLVVPEGTDDVAVGTVIALIAGDGEAVAPREPERAEAAPAPAAIVTVPPAAAPPPLAVEAAPAPVAGREDSGVNATPLARRIAKAKGLSLLGMAGSGARGRIVKADLGLPAPIAAPSPAAAAPAPAPVHAPPAGVPVETVRLSGMRRTIARRLAEAKQSVPHFYLTAHCRIDALLALRRDLNDGLAERGVKLSVNDLVMKAMALAMVEVPDTNVQYAGEEMHRFGRVDIAMAVAIEGGLVTPVITDVTSLSLSALATRSRDLAARARDGRLAPEEYQGGTASLSNLGMYGIDEMIPVINPPQALIVGVGAGIEKPWKVDGAIALATIMTCTASFDHRAIDGAAAARFMAALRALIEQPLRIVS